MRFWFWAYSHRVLSWLTTIVYDRMCEAWEDVNPPAVTSKSDIAVRYEWYDATTGKSTPVGGRPH